MAPNTWCSEAGYNACTESLKEASDFGRIREPIESLRYCSQYRCPGQLLRGLRFEWITYFGLVSSFPIRRGDHP